MNDPTLTTGAHRRGWDATVGTTIALQWLVILVFAAAAGLLAGTNGGLSLLVGGTAVALPNALLALWLTLRVHRVGRLGAAAMLGGEFLKLGLTMALLVLFIVRLKPTLSWLALIIGVVIALKAQWLALWFTRRF